MIPELLAPLFPDGRPLCYRTFVNGKLVLTHWTAWLGEAVPGVHTFECHLELDPSALGGGGALVRIRSRLQVDAELRPLRYRIQAPGQVMTVSVADGKVQATLPDGTRASVPWGDARYLIQTQMPGLEALVVTHATRGGRATEEVAVRLFLADKLTPIPFKLAPAAGEPERTFRSSHEEVIRFDPSGVPVSLAKKSEGVETLHVDPPPELPDWKDAAFPAQERATYQPPPDAHFELRDVTIPGPATPIGATLTVPQRGGPGPFPAVLFISGTGRHDRHGLAGEIDIGSHEILDALSERAGFVALRYDKRGAGTTRTGPDVLEGGLKPRVADALACWDYLTKLPEVDPGRVFLMGHSEGGNVALILAARERLPVRGLVLAAAIGRPLDQLLADQLVEHCKAQGRPQEQIDQGLREQEELMALIRSGREWTMDNVPDKYYGAIHSRSWFVEHFANPPDALIADIGCPVLICQGEKDFQVSATRDAARLDAAARAAGVDVTCKTYATLDHLFKPIEGTSTLASYYQKGRHVDPVFIEDLRAWLTARGS